ncbi:MAG: flagellar biosynthesis protein FlhB [Lachnospiraceae bacterium]|nr:flagellar biosynthesis protein FlhB [Lachnospiraceae bacterium]
MKFYLKYDLQWFAKDGPGGEKTEPATAKKLKDAREEGKVAKSKELSSAVDLIALFLVLKIFVSYIGRGFIEEFSAVYNKIPEIAEAGGKDMSSFTAHQVFRMVIVDSLKILLPFLLVGVIVALFIGIVQVGWKVSTKPMQPKLDKFNPINGFKRMFSKESLFELVKSVLKIGLIVYVAYTSVNDQKEQLFILYEIPLLQAIMLCGSVIINTGLKISLIYLLVGILDWAYQKHHFNEEMKMTKQEVKDEYKNTEGNPEIKGRQRSKMREVSQRRMMQDVPKADVVITNPTHLSVAIVYDNESAKAPIVLAKGEDYMALKIREVAKENHVEIVENKPLARTLYATVDIGQEIPPELYQAVAEVLALVYHIKHPE